MDAIEQARKDAGNSPTWEAEGFFQASERSDYKDAKYNPREKARKRAEAAVLRKRFGLRFNVGDNGDRSAVEIVDATWTEQKPPADPEPPEPFDQEKILHELGY